MALGTFSQTQYVLDFIGDNPGLTQKELNQFIDVSNLRVILKRLRDRGDIVNDQGKYFRVNTPDNKVVDKVVDTLILKREESERQEYLKEFLNVVVESIRSCNDHNIKIQYIQEGRRLVKDLR